MNNKLSYRLLAIAAIAAGAIGSAHAQTFNYTTSVNPTNDTNPVGGITVTGISNSGNLVAPKNNVTLATITPNGLGDAPDKTFDFTITWTSVIPQAGPQTDTSLSAHLTGLYTFLGNVASASFDENSLAFDFGGAGKYTLNNFDLKSDATKFTADVRYTPAPEPGTWAAFAFTGLGAAGLMLRARKARRTYGLAT